MADPSKPTRPSAWLSKQAMADALDVTVNYFDREVRRHAMPSHVRRDGKRLLFYSRGVLDAWYGARLRAAPDLDDVDTQFLLMDLPLDWDS